jgi:hypothetical protein
MKTIHQSQASFLPLLVVFDICENVGISHGATCRTLGYDFQSVCSVSFQPFC